MNASRQDIYIDNSVVECQSPKLNTVVRFHFDMPEYSVVYATLSRVYR
jgi:hypothetical protein